MKLFFNCLFLVLFSSGLFAQSPFVTTWQTLTDGDSITIPTRGGGYDYSIDWGDGTVETNLSGSVTHIYATAGTFTVSISGSFPQIYFNNKGDKDKILTVEQWGTQQWRSMANAFYGCSNLNITNPGIDSPDLSAVTDMSRTFYGASAFDGDVTTWDVSTVKKFTRTFSEATNFNQAVGDWDVSSGTHFNNMFDEATAFNQDLSGWNTASAQRMSSTFKDALAFDQSLSQWDMTNVTQVSDMLSGSGMSTTNYDATLTGWAGQTLQNGVSFRATGLYYCASETDRQRLIDDFGWNITGDKRKGNCLTTDVFITTWQTTTANESITIPTRSGGYDYWVEWGDGTIDEHLTGDASHTYATPGVHTVLIYGDFPQIYFNNQGDKDKILTIEQWGNIQWRSMLDAFEGCSNLNITNPAIDAPNLSEVTDLSGAFSQAVSFNGDITAWDVSNVKKFNRMFSGTMNFNQPITGWNLTSAEMLNHMFSDAISFNQPIGTWNVSSVTYYNNMFFGAISFNQDLSNWNTAGAHKMVNMFRDATAFDQSLGQWNLSSAIQLTDMLTNTGLSSANYDATLSGWASQPTLQSGVTLRATGQYYCQSEADRQRLIDDFGWTITGDKRLGNCQPTDVFITTWRTTSDGESITIPTRGSGYDYWVEWGDGAIDEHLTGDATHSYATAGVHTVLIYGDFPEIYFNNQGDKDKILTIEQWGSIQWRSMQNAFAGCTNLNITNHAIDTPDLSGVTNLTRMFSDATSFNGDITAWDVSNVKKFGRMLEGAVNFDQAIGNWKVSQAETFTYMFGDASAFNQPIGNWDVSNATIFTNMFDGATAFNQDLSSWNTALAKKMGSMFRDATAFNQSLGQWNMSGVDNLSNMLTNSGLSTANYDATLNGWANQTALQTGVILRATGLEYCSSEADRQRLIDDFGWSITGDAKELGCISESSFVTTWETTTASESITIPTNGTGYDYTVNWGDGTVEEHVVGDATHTYDSAGVHKVSIDGEFPQIYFNNEGDKDKILTVEQWGDGEWTSMESAFSGCSKLNITNPDIDEPNLSAITDMSNMFNEADSFDGEIGVWDVSTVTNMDGMFANAASFNADISDWDVSSVTQMDDMFEGAASFDQPLGEWELASLESTEIVLSGSGLSVTSYDATLRDWVNSATTPLNVTLQAAGLTYCAAVDARQALINDYGWTIVGDAKSATCYTEPWQLTYGGTGHDTDVHTLKAADGGYLVSTSSKSGIGGTKTTANRGGWDWWTFKVDSEGQVEWEIDLGNASEDGQRTKSIQTQDGHFLMAGHIISNQTDQITTASKGARDIFLIKVSEEDQSTIWQARLGGNSNDVPYDIVELANGEIVVGGYTTSSDIPGHPNMGSLDMYLAKLSADGTLIWENTYGGNNFESADKMALSPNGGVYVGGYTRSTDLGHVNNGDFDYWLMEIDADGNMLWDELYGGAALDAIRTIAVDGDGNIIVGGETYSSAGGTKSQASFGRQDMWIVKTTSQGELIWEKTFGGAQYEMATGIQVLPDNQIIVGGYSNSPSGGQRTVPHYGALDFWMFRLTEDGELAWQKAFGGSGNDGAFEVVSYDAGSRHLTFTGEFSQGQSGTITEQGYGGPDPLIVNIEIETESPFVTTWQTTSSNESITIPTTGTGYNYIIDWGDGTVQAGNTGDATHTYAIAGTYEVSITGDFPRIYFNNGGDKDKIRSVDRWGETVWSSMAQAFAGCSQLIVTATDSPDLSAVTDMSGMFAGAASLNQSLENWDVSNVQSMANLFQNASTFNQPLDSWEMAQVTDISGMFEGASSFNQTLGSWNVGMVTNMAGTFNGASSFNQPLDAWNIAWVADMSNMLSATALSTENYDMTLVAWGTLPSVQTGITLGAAGLTYCAGDLARKSFMQNADWTFVGDAPSVGCEPSVFYAVTDGPWNDGATWSLTPDGTPVNLIPDDFAQVEINGFEVQLSDNAECSALLIGNKLNTLLSIDGVGAHLVVFGDVLLAKGNKNGQKILSVINGGRLECR